MERIFFDARFIRLDHHDGISRFSTELIHALVKKIDITAIIWHDDQLKFLPKGIDYIKVNSPESTKEFFIAKKLNKIGAKMVYSPMQVMGSAGRKYKLVLTLHDLIYYRHRKPPQDLNLLIRIIWRLYHLSYIPQRLLLNRADAIVTVSQTTKDLIQKHKLTRKPISVVYNAVSSPNKVARRTKPESKNLIYIGSFMPYKNVETLAKAIALLPEYQLHLLSKISGERKTALEKFSANIVFHNGVTDQKYSDLLKEAFALVTASKDEGFGIPLVEAMAHGTPVIVSDLDIFHEVAQSAGTYFNPDDYKDFANKVLSLAESNNWKTKSELASDQAQKFSWDKSAEELIKVFRALES